MMLFSMKLFSILLSLSLLTAIVSRAATIHVPADEPTIQAGINAANTGDTVLVAPGVYSGADNRDMVFYGKEVKLMSEAGPEATSIICGGSPSMPHRAFIINSDIDSSLLIRGFTISGGYTDSSGGAILASSRAGFRIENCVFEENSAVTYGGAISGSRRGTILENCRFTNNSSSYGGAVHNVSTVDNCSFTDNYASVQGSAIYSNRGSIVSSEFISNKPSADVVYFTSGPMIYNCLFADNEGFAFGSYAILSYGISNCTFVGNDGVFNLEFDSHIRLSNSILAFNNDPVVSCYRCPPDCPYSSQGWLYNCNIYGHDINYPACFGSQEFINGNFSADPEFCNADQLDFDFRSTSPCIGAGIDIYNHDTVDVGAFGVGCFPTAIEDEGDLTLPADFALYQNFPNPFNPQTTIEFSLPKSDHTSLMIYNALGQRIRTLIDGRLSAGPYSVTWDGKSDDDQTVSSGLYFYELKTSESVQSRKMILLK